MTDFGLLIFTCIFFFFLGMILTAYLDEKKEKFKEMKLRALRRALKSDRKKVETLRNIISDIQGRAS